MNKKSKIYIAGHTGFVGGSLHHMLRKEHENISTYTRNELDLTKPQQTLELFREKQFDYVFMCAAKCGGLQANLEDPYGFLLKNLEIQNSLIEASIKTKVKKVLFLGSSCIYPKDYKQPLKEEYLFQAPVEPTNEGYALAKIAGLKLCEYANSLYGKKHDGDLHKTRFISLMPCNVYGPGDDFDLHNSHVMAALVRKFVDAKRYNLPEVVVWGDGSSRREFLYVEDLADAMTWSINNIDKTDSFLNVGTGCDMSIMDLVGLISNKVGYQGKISFDISKPTGMKKKCLDVTKINKLGWNAKTSLEEGIERTIRHYRRISE
jgi:GDP-L-fucose synthase